MIKKYGVIIDITNDSLVFWSNHYTHIRAISLTILNLSNLSIETVVIRIKKAITPEKMIKKGWKEDITDFLQMPDKLSSKMRKQINKSKQKANIRETILRKVIINSLDNFDKKELLISLATIKISKPKT